METSLAALIAAAARGRGGGRLARPPGGAPARGAALGGRPPADRGDGARRRDGARRDPARRRDRRTRARRGRRRGRARRDLRRADGRDRGAAARGSTGARRSARSWPRLVSTEAAARSTAERARVDGPRGGGRRAPGPRLRAIDRAGARRRWSARRPRRCGEAIGRASAKPRSRRRAWPRRASERAAAEAAADGAVKRAKRIMGIAVGRFYGHYLTERLHSVVPLPPGEAGAALDRARGGQPARHRERGRRDAGRSPSTATASAWKGSTAWGARWRAGRSPACSGSPGTARDPAAVTQAAREIATALDAELDRSRPARLLDAGDPAGAPGDRQAGRPPQLPDQLHAEPVEARRRGGLPVRHDGRRAGPRPRSSRGARR